MAPTASPSSMRSTRASRANRVFESRFAARAISIRRFPEPPFFPGDDDSGDSQGERKRVRFNVVRAMVRMGGKPRGGGRGGGAAGGGNAAFGSRGDAELGFGAGRGDGTGGSPSGRDASPR